MAENKNIINQRDRLASPCMGICTTTYGDPVCKGCKRFVHEIADWSAYSEGQRTAVSERLQNQARNAVLSYFRIVDEKALWSYVEQENRVRYYPDWCPEHTVFQLLFYRIFSGFEALRECGVEPLPEYRSQSLEELVQHVDSLYNRLGQDYYNDHVVSQQG
ncbi:MAG: DUF1289 domain-containing protein [Gammaproteobacteria bacterium AqS3]|nr:DUF1289 domain-containing protein [Gammaproteobacteria bacterium AqS3]